jgi:hypothetical protein
MLLRVAAWLFPWFAVLVVAGGLAYAINVQIVQAWSIAPPTSTKVALTPPQGSEWVLIETIGEDGTRYQMECLARDGTFTTDEVVLEVSELNAVAARACQQLEAVPRH